jgi:hypothetical protein
MTSFDRLLEHIDAFIRKYYKNQMVRGALLFIGVFLVTFLLTTSLEYIGRFNSSVRAFLFYSFITVNSVILYRFLFIPLSKLYAFGKRINRYQAAEIIGMFFPIVSDRLKNTLQLNDALNQNEGNIELLRASVQQRSDTLAVVPFSTAIDIRQNRRYVKYLIPVFLLMVVIGIAAPGLFTQGTERVMNYEKEFKPEAPFVFMLTSKDLVVEEGEDVPLTLELKGRELPDQVYLVSENGKFLMTRTSKTAFTGIIKRPKKSSEFYFIANEFESERFDLEVFGKSAIGKLQAKLHYPSYLGKTDEIIDNAGDMTIPEGTDVEWQLVTKNTEWVDFMLNGKAKRFVQQGFKVQRSLRTNTMVRIAMSNKYKHKVDSASFFVEVTKDAYPSIITQEKIDSISEGVRYFTGRIADDYGLDRLQFVYVIHSENGKKVEKRIGVQRVVGTDMPFDFAVDFKRENIALKDRIEYYFLVSDNDGVNGSKSTKSETFTYQLPTLEELNDKRDEQQEQTKESLNDALSKTKEFEKKLEKLKRDALNSKSADWNKLNQVKQLQQEQQQMIEDLQQIQEQMKESLQEKDQLSEMDKELLEKQELIEKLLEELMDDELKKLLEDLEKALQEQNKEQLKDKLDDIEQSNEDMKKQLDRSLELLKRLQVNEKIDDIEKELKELAKEQEELKEKIEKEELSTDKATEEQQKVNEKFEELKKDLNELKQLNETLDSPMNLGDTKEAEEKIDQDLNDSKSALQQSKEKKAGEKQQSAADEMEKMAEQLDQMQQQANQQQEEEDMDALRAILENLMSLSFDQEDLMKRFNRLSESDPAYRRYGKKQRAIIDDTRIVRDSLLALAKRQPKIASFVDKELNEIKKNQDLALEDIDERRKRELGVRQQSVMTAYNNLALLLNESLQSMQQQMQSKMQGQGSCNKPGGKGQPKPGSSMNPGDMKQLLKKQLDQLQKGPNPGGKQPGDQPGNQPGQKSGMGMQGLGNKEISKMAAEQTAIRQRLEELRKELNKEGQGKGNQLNPLIKELEEQERDLINKRFSPEMVQRQKNILTRLLESEKALMERGFEEKRESKSGKNENYGNQIRFDEYNRQKLKQVELLHTVDPSYRKYYKDKANEYFNNGL